MARVMSSMRFPSASAFSLPLFQNQPAVRQASSGCSTRSGSPT
jgi:hypothetical protein